MDTSQLADLADKAGHLADATRWYLFGSSARGIAPPRDVDVLIVYTHRDVSRARELSEWLRTKGPMPPVDLVLLSEEEATQTAFIESEAAILAWASATEA